MRSRSLHGAFLAVVTFAMLTNPRREGGFMPGELVAPEDRPFSTVASPFEPILGPYEAGRSPSTLRKRPATDRDYWRWYGGTHIGDRVVGP